MSARMVVTGGAGFLGSHLCEHLLARGDRVVCVDDFSTGVRSNIQSLIAHPNFSLIEADVACGFTVEGPISAVLHLASPASPIDYLQRPLETMAVGSEGTRQCLELARDRGARFLMASTSEVYGEPAQHPQSESYWGNVNPIGPRSVYDEAKRFSEALTMAYHRLKLVDVAIVRIFNTYGPRLRPGDGRVVSNFIVQALTGQDLTVYGDGSQTRSLCYVDDEVRGIVAMLDSGLVGPVNLGNPEEHSVLELAQMVIAITRSSSKIAYKELPADDPTRRCPDISVATRDLSWQPTVELSGGLVRTTDWLRGELGSKAI